MAVYVVMEPLGRGNAGDVTFVRDGFSWPAFLVPPLWLLWHRLWIEAVLAFVAIGLLIALGETFGALTTAVLLIVLVMLYVGLEGQALRIAALTRRGWKQQGVVVADDLDDADARYALGAEDEPEEHAPPPLSMVPDPSLARLGSLGLVPFSGRP